MDGRAAEFSFERLTRADFGLLCRWLAEPHVARWWHHDPSPEAVDADFGPSADGLEPGKDFIVSADGRPIGLVQFSRFADYPEDAEEMDDVYPVGEGVATIDYLIGEPDLVGRGMGSAMIAAFVRFVWEHEHDVSSLVVPVNSANIASWRALRRAGFRLVARGHMEPDNPAEAWAHEVLRCDRRERTKTEMVAAALEMDPVLVPLAAELLADFEELGSDADDIVEVLTELGVGRSGRVVDLGSGKGAVSIAIAREFGCEVVGIELHQPFVEHAIAAAEAAALGDRCTFMHGDVLALAGTVAEADVVVYAALGDVLGPLEETIRTLRLYAKPGGHVVIVDCCLRDGSAATFPGFEGYVPLEATRRRLTCAGDALVMERLDTEEPDGDDPAEADRIADRARELGETHPELEEALLGFARSQRAEYAYLAAHTIAGIWVIQRRGAGSS